jgi:hypothetical protein
MALHALYPQARIKLLSRDAGDEQLQRGQKGQALLGM